ncbi:MAG: hypothetical protein A2939_03645 [Parcubacteria group bacterium RIFCSPLOWO2_01_FULL_48_18]|nr:MAG: hypothetical protein A3J67_02585 [Parcubacteria group bacterium RIFCSPHIGHO2_02_FULL_48_10b]OHB22371.1 MAG: hypothetical protein A2939_03645 [Parcubacteria group bacterium RIFCSPLOWO2_01_FULL_48_18]
MNREHNDVPQACINPLTLADLLLAVHLCPTEVSGLGFVEKTGNVYTITGEPVIFRQVCSYSRTEFDPVAHGKWTQEMMREGRGPLINKYRLWWHSHVYFESRFSKTDNETIESWSSIPLNEWWMSLVLNKRGSMNLRLDVFKPVRQPPFLFEGLAFTDPATKRDILHLMRERENHIQSVIEQNIVYDPFEKLFDYILDGIFE